MKKDNVSQCCQQRYVNARFYESGIFTLLTTVMQESMRAKILQRQEEEEEEEDLAHFRNQGRRPACANLLLGVLDVLVLARVARV